MSYTENRINTIDVFRAVTMLLMIFVNDFWTLEGIPSWLEHSRSDQDFLGFSDVIFPCFLFIVGMSIPYAIRNRVEKGEGNIKILFHIGIRSLALLVMGFFTVNINSINEEASGISNNWFQIIMVAAFFLIWNVYPKTNNWKRFIYAGIQVIGVLILGILFYQYRGGNDGHSRMTHQWWGILGEIGWTYLISASLYLFARKSRLVLIALWLLFIILNIADHSGWFNTIIPGGGAFQGFAFAGICASLIIDSTSDSVSRKKIPFIYLGIGISLLVAGILLRRFFIISKIQATPTWVLLCTGIAFLLLSLIYILVELKGKEMFFRLIKPAGTSTLTCYLIPYVYYSIAVYTFTLPEFLKTGIPGLVKSMLFAMLIIGITALLGKFKVKLKI